MNVQCDLCPKGCVIAPGQSGECRIRVNVGGKLLAVTHGYPCAVHVDPIEKKPMFHFLPGTSALSLATVGCNLHCKNCQNWQISQANPEDVEAYQLPPNDLAALAKQNSCVSVAYTYTEPLVYYEYTLESSIRVREAGLKNILVTAGYINEAPLRRLGPYIDGANIDLKSINDRFYRDICDATVQPVLNALTIARALGIEVEVTNLVIPTLNDTDNDLRRLSRWVARNLGRETPLHFSRFFPQYRMENLAPTPAATLDRAKQIAESEGLHHVYIGNLLRPDSENTYCPSCHACVIRRLRYTIIENRLQFGRCPECQAEVHGVWQ